MAAEPDPTFSLAEEKLYPLFALQGCYPGGAGRGAASRSLMLVGEQPGDKEDLAGKPFVGPAGRMLDEALRDAGIAREETYVTNAVKHFKHEMRGKRRLHQRPNNYEVERCKIWLDWERSLVKPSIIVEPGVTAARS
jgi:uracil-DNA glycosylase